LISARFLGQVHDQRAMPVIVEMLTEDIQIHANHDNDQWAFYWRCYAPKLLRQWQTEPVLHALYHALKIWREAENFFDHDFTYWMDFEASLCYELGYRDAFELVLQLPLQAPHHQFLLISMAQGYYTKSHAVSLLDECKQQSRRHTHTKTVKNDIINILATKCKLSQAQAQNLLKEYHEAFREGEIGF
jgi:hypothetical protein